MSLGEEPLQAATDHPIYFDHKIRLAGVYNAGLNRTEYDFPFHYIPIKGVHLGTGHVFTPTRNGSTFLFHTPGDYSAGNTVFGRPVLADIYLTRPYARDDRGRPMLHPDLQILTLAVKHHKSVRFDVECNQGVGRERIESMSKTLLNNGPGEDNYGRPDTGTFKVWVQGAAEDTRIAIKNSTCRPCTIAGLEYVVEPKEPPR